MSDLVKAVEKTLQQKGIPCRIGGDELIEYCIPNITVEVQDKDGILRKKVAKQGGWTSFHVVNPRNVVTRLLNNKVQVTEQELLANMPAKEVEEVIEEEVVEEVEEEKPKKKGRPKGSKNIVKATE